MAKNPKYESEAVTVVQQFAHAMRWADNDESRLRRLRDAIQGVVDSSSVGVEPTGFVGAAGVPGVFTNYVGGGSDLPDWYVHPDGQLERQESWLRSLGFGQGDIPTGGPEGVTPTRNALPLLRVVMPGTRRVASRRRSIEVHMDAIGQQLTATSRKLYLWDGFKAFQKEPRLATGLSDPAPGVSWVLFDPFAHLDAENGHRVADLAPVQNGWALAGLENLSALKAWPGYGPAMDGRKTPYINLAGFRTASGGVPYAYWWVDDSRLGFDVYSAVYRSFDYASPRFRDCLR